MRFKIVLLSLIFLLSACAKDTQNPEEGDNFQLDLGKTDCFEGTGVKFERFIAGLGTEKDIHAVWICASKILIDFGQFTRGASPNGYTGEEIQGFLTRYFFKDGLSIEVINSTLKLKQVVVGGEGNFLTQSELRKLIQFIGVLDSMTRDIYPAAKILFTDANVTATEANWFKAYQALSKATQRLTTVLSQSGKDYAFADLQALINAWAVQLNVPNGHLLMRLKDLVPVLNSAKTLLIAGPSDRLTSSEWPALVSTLVDGYSVYRMAVRSTSPDDGLSILGSARLPWLFEKLIGLLDQSVQRHELAKVELTEIQNFLNGLKTLGYLPATLTVDQATSAIQFALNKVFAGGLPAGTALTATTVSEMRRLLTAWKAYDLALVNQDFSSVVEFGGAIRPGGKALSLDAKGRLELPFGQAGVSHEFSAAFTVLEWLGAQWGTWPLSQAKVNTIASDLIGLLHSFDLLKDIEASAFAPRIMREANLFMPSSNGDMILEKAEAAQYAVFVLSASRSSHLLDVATTSACAGDAVCKGKQLFEQRDLLLANFPKLLLWLNNSPTQWTKFSQSLGKIVGADQFLMQFVVMHYIETYMVRFDKNGDQLLNLSETMVAFPIYKPILGVLLPEHGLGAGDIEPMYTFLFKHGASPNDISNGKLTYLWWKINKSSWSYSSDRNILAGILASLTEMTK